MAPISRAIVDEEVSLVALAAANVASVLLRAVKLSAIEDNLAVTEDEPSVAIFFGSSSWRVCASSAVVNFLTDAMPSLPCPCHSS
eukprot:scaffold4443_cov124-Skeletonema_marinoi.AAC.2